MRYNDIDTISFTDSNGNSFPIKDIRPIPSEPISFTVDPIGNVDIDEIASRRGVYGDLAEDQSYRIFDANSVELMESNFDASMLSEIKIPL